MKDLNEIQIKFAEQIFAFTAILIAYISSSKLRLLILILLIIVTAYLILSTLLMIRLKRLTITQSSPLRRIIEDFNDIQHLLDNISDRFEQDQTILSDELAVMERRTQQVLENFDNLQPYLESRKHLFLFTSDHVRLYFEKHFSLNCQSFKLPILQAKIEKYLHAYGTDNQARQRLLRISQNAQNLSELIASNRLFVNAISGFQIAVAGQQQKAKKRKRRGGGLLGLGKSPKILKGIKAELPMQLGDIVFILFFFVLLLAMRDEVFEVASQFYQYDEGDAYSIRVVAGSDTTRHIREKIQVIHHDEQVAEGILTTPKNDRSQHPCILLLHGLSNQDLWQQKNDHYEGMLIEQLLREGYAVMSLGAQRPWIAAGDLESPFGESLLTGNLNHYRNSFVRSVRNYRRVVDYLSKRTDIDRGRIGLIGYGIGGLMAFALTGVEPRIRNTITCSTPNVETIFEAYPRKDYTAILPHTFTRAIGGRPFLMLMGKNDKHSSLDWAKNLHDLISSDSKALVLYDSDHRLPASYLGDIVQWLQKNVLNTDQELIPH